MPPRAVAAADLGQPQAAAEDRFHVTLLTRFFARRAHVFCDARIAREVAIHVLLGSRALDAELRRETERGHAIDESEVDDFSVAPLFRVHCRAFERKYLGRRRAMNILSRRKRAEQSRVL